MTDTAAESTVRAPFAPWDRRDLPGSFDVVETARRVGNYKWTEMKLFEALGGWVATVPELDVKMRLGTHCYHHAWHAELWHKRLPELRIDRRPVGSLARRTGRDGRGVRHLGGAEFRVLAPQPSQFAARVEAADVLPRFAGRAGIDVL